MSDPSASGREAWFPCCAGVSQSAISFYDDVKPVLAVHCYPCHAGEAKKGGLLLDTLPHALAGGKSVKIDTFVVPATSEIAAGLKHERLNGQTLEDVFLSAGAKIGQPSCAACLGGPSDTFGRLNAPLSCISTTNRNYPGRMGHAIGRGHFQRPGGWLGAMMCGWRMRA